jgi:hypothetical protein
MFCNVGWIASGRLRLPPSFAFNFSSIENAETSNLRSASSVETISTPKQIWFTVDVLESQPLAIVHFIMSSRFTVPDVKHASCLPDPSAGQPNAGTINGLGNSREISIHKLM